MSHSLSRSSTSLTCLAHWLPNKPAVSSSSRVAQKIFDPVIYPLSCQHYTNLNSTPKLYSTSYPISSLTSSHVTLTVKGSKFLGLKLSIANQKVMCYKTNPPTVLPLTIPCPFSHSFMCSEQAVHLRSRWWRSSVLSCLLALNSTKSSVALVKDLKKLARV